MRWKRKSEDEEGITYKVRVYAIEIKEEWNGNYRV